MARCNAPHPFLVVCLAGIVVTSGSLAASGVVADSRIKSKAREIRQKQVDTQRCLMDQCQGREEMREREREREYVP